MQEVSKSGKFVTKKAGTNVKPADLKTKPLPRPKIEQFMKLMGYQFAENDQMEPKNEIYSVFHEKQSAGQVCRALKHEAQRTEDVQDSAGIVSTAQWRFRGFLWKYLQTC